MIGDRQDEAALWGAALNGDSAAFGMIFDLHKDRVYRHAVRWLTAGPEAEDVTAIVFLELWRRRAGVRLVGGSVLPWMLVTTANVVRNHARAERRYRRLLSALPREPAAAGADEAALSSVGLIDPALRDALARLSPQDAGLLVMISFEDMSVAEVAGVLGISAQAVKTRLHRARARVRSLLPDPPQVHDAEGATR